MKNQIRAKEIREVNFAILFACLLTILFFDVTNAWASQKTQTVTVNTNKIINNDSLTDQQKADQLLIAAEKLINPASFMYANEVVNKALRYNPDHGKAQFYHEFLKPVMSFEGLLKRIEPLAKTENEKTEYQRVRENLKSNPAWNEFLLNGPADISSESDMQRFFDEYKRAVSEYREYLKTRKSQKQLELTLYSVESHESAESLSELCKANRSQGGVYSLTNCLISEPITMKAEQADMEIMQHVAAGLQVHAILLTSYRVDGTIDYARTLKDQGKPNTDVSPTEKEMISHFLGVQEFGRLRRNNSLRDIQALGVEMIAGVKWAQRLQQSLCPKGTGDLENRPGYMLSSGVCIPEKVSKNRTTQMIAVMESALQGQSARVFVAKKTPYIAELAKDRRNQATYRTDINFIAPIVQPIADLKSLAPTEYDACGNALNVGDPLLGGAFPNRDANEYLRATGFQITSCEPVEFNRD